MGRVRHGSATFPNGRIFVLPGVKHRCRPRESGDLPPIFNASPSAGRALATIAN